MALKILIYNDNKMVGQCSYAVLDSYAVSLERTFTFKVPEFPAGFTVNNISELSIEVYFTNCYNSRLLYSDFRLTLISHIGYLGSDLKVTGLPEFSTYPTNYNQNVVTIFNKWQTGDKVNWHELTIDEKEDYLTACRIWSGLPQKLTPKTDKLNLENVYDSITFSILFGETFLGQRGFFSIEYNVLHDCLIEIWNRNPESLKTQIILYNAAHIKDLDWFKDFLTLTLRYGIKIID